MTELLELGNCRRRAGDLRTKLDVARRTSLACSGCRACRTSREYLRTDPASRRQSRAGRRDSASRPFRSTNSSPPIACRASAVACASVIAPVVHVHAARLHEPTRLALRRRELHARHQIDDRRYPRRSNVAPASVDGTSSNTASTSSTAASRCLRRTARADACSARATCSAPCTSAVTSRASTRCASRFSGARCVAALELLDRRAIEKREELQVRHDVAVVGVQPELVEPERRRARGDRARPCPLRSCRTSRPTPSSSAATPGRAPSCARSFRIRSMPAVMLPH